MNYKFLRIIFLLFILILVWEYINPKKTYIKQSNINGNGLFANKNFKIGDIILYDVFSNKPSNVMIFNPIQKGVFNKYISIEGKHVNHCSRYFNSDIHTEDHRLYQLIATQNIKKGDEITANYDIINNKYPFIGKSLPHYKSC
tara:strand:+ start:88 stop:516 length:429 start_codon:yes stop_codon:yes gene_type:complete